MSTDQGDQARRAGLSPTAVASRVLSPAAACAAASAELRSRIGEVTALVCASLPAAAEVAGDDASEYSDSREAAVAAAVEYCLEVIERQRDTWGPVPPELLAHTRRSVHAGVRPGVLVRRYMTAHQRLVALLGEAIPGEKHPEPEATIEHLRRRYRCLSDHIISAIEQEHEHERQRVEQSPEHRRSMLVRRLLVEALSPQDLKELAYDVHSSWHVCVIVACPDGVQVLQRLKRRYPGKLLPVPSHGSITCAWLGASRRMSPVDIKRLIVAQGDLAPVAMGDPARGLDGWRETHREAMLALPIAVRRTRLTRCADYLPVIAASQDATIVRMYHERYIAPLDRLHKRGESTRKALRAYFEHGHSSSSAACAIKVSRHTVANHVHKAMNALDTPLTMTGLEIALDLEELGYMDGMSDTGRLLNQAPPGAPLDRQLANWSNSLNEPVQSGDPQTVRKVGQSSCQVTSNNQTMTGHNLIIR